MTFSSILFLFFFLPAALLFCRYDVFIPPSVKRRMSVQTKKKHFKIENLFILIFSLFFYGWGEPKYIVIMIFTILLNYICALLIHSNRTKGKQGAAKAVLVVSVILNLGILGFFKYFNFFLTNINNIFGLDIQFLKLALPIGISFYTFQLLSYVVDVYRGDAEAQDKYWHVLLYAALFHQCIAGPIVRYKTIAKELFDGRDETADRARGCTRFAVGLAKKTVLANACGALADSLLLTDAAIGSASQLAENLAALSNTPALALWIGIIAYAFQIYFDFSGYSDMAIGMGQMIGLHYLENFNYPYISRTATEFWRRWHMSLGTFFRDYVYIPLGGNRKGRARAFLNLFIVWALTGLWHGASWNFVLWGLYYFVLLMLDRLFWQKLLDKLPKAVSAILSHITLPLALLFGWVLFKFTSLPRAAAVSLAMSSGKANAFTSFTVTAE